MDDVAGVIIALIIAGVLLWIAARALSSAWKKYEAGYVTVYDYERGVRYHKGAIVDILGPGRYATWPAPDLIARQDMREQSASVAGQEILTADKMPVRVTVIVVHRIADPRLYSTATATPPTRLHQIVQMALRERIASRALDDLLTDRGALTDGLAEELGAEAARLGIIVVSVRLLDLTLAGPAKQAFADIWKAQKEGLAALERARGEQAALRALANAARQLKGNPELMNLRVLQALAGAPGKTPPTLVLGGAPGLVSVSKDAAPEDSSA